MVSDKVVAVLGVSPRSIYKKMPGVDAYDQKRDLMTFGGGMPGVYHPPCRLWSAFCAHQAKAPESEKELGLFCAEKLRECGGVLEHPAYSRLFDAAKLPKPGEKPDGGLRSLEVFQYWWGYPVRKRTWLCFSGVDWDSIVLPFRLHDHGDDRGIFASMSKKQRSETVPEFAAWLVGVARSVYQ